jgi:hypothetical protein
MPSDTSRGTFDDVMAGQQPETVAVAHHLRQLFLDALPEVIEIPRPKEQHVAYAAPGGRANAVFGYICPVRDYVRLGFYYGGSLPDPSGLLVGEGKRLRHVKIYSPAEAGRPEIRQLLVDGFRERQAALPGRSGPSETGSGSVQP